LQHYRVGVAANRAPWTPLERKLQLIWAAALRVEPETVGADDQFFHLGGDSITAMNVVARLQDCGLQLTVANIFSHPRLADQALLLNPVSKSEVGDLPAPFSLLDDPMEQSLEAAIDKCQVPPESIEDIYPCTPLQARFLSLTARGPLLLWASGCTRYHARLTFWN
jgi:aryl carrier-like protein